jgi:hypothetical protein
MDKSLVIWYYDNIFYNLSSYYGRMEMNKQSVNLWVHNTYENFNKGSFDNARVANDSKAQITLVKNENKYAEVGVYTSDIIHTLPFQSLILSWNAETPEKTAIRIEAQVLVNKDEQRFWSNWLSFGTWHSEAERSSASKTDNIDELAYVDTDTLKIKGFSGETASAVRYRVTLITSDPKITPTVKLIAGTLRNTEARGDIHALNDCDSLPELNSLNKELKVPRFSQMLREPKIASVICSPTSITMILNYYGLNLVPEEVAAGVFDTEYDGYGNWTFNTAFAGSKGFDSYVSYCSSINDLKKEIYNNHPLAVSVKYKNSEDIDAKLPVIHGAPIKKTNGHLIVVCGFVKEDGKEFVIVNDPAAESDEAVRLKYLIEEFDAAWKTSGRVAYIIHP